MNLKQYYTVNQNGDIIVSAQQSSDFAKQVAGDFNPIHDPDSKRFCVPGDLLFAVALQRYGIYQKMAFDFLGLVKADTPLQYPATLNTDAGFSNQVVNDKGKPFLAIQCSGELSDNPDQIEQAFGNYVAFSGHNFPHILVPLMQQHQVMINPQRPLVIYQRMSFELQELEFDTLEIKLENTSLQVSDKRGDARLEFSFNSAGKTIGSGSKQLLLSGLREYDQQGIDQMCEEYLRRQQNG